MMNVPLSKQKLRLFSSLIAVGNPIVDIIAEVDDQDILNYGLKRGFVNYTDGNNIGFYEKIEQKLQVLHCPGGSAQNILRALSWSLPNMDNNQIKLSMLGGVGDDIFKNKIMSSFDLSNIRTGLLQVISNTNTSRCAVGTLNGERYFLSDILASKNLSQKFCQEKMNEILSHDALLIEGFFIRENSTLCRDICNSFYNAGKYIILTLGDTSIIDKFRNEIIAIANMADMIVGNLNAAQLLAGVPNGNTKIDDLFIMIHSLLNNIKDRILVVTVGCQGVFCSKYNSATRIENHFQTFPKRKIKQNEVVDFNGAGDAFLGGFLSQQMQNKTLEECCRLGNEVASIAIRNHGCNFYINNIRN